MPTRTPLVPLQSSDFSSAFPKSSKVFVGQVPMREIALSGGEPPLRVYDTSGPQGCDVREGLPRLREPWILGRPGVAEVPRSYLASATDRRPMPAVLAGRMQTALRGHAPVTQLHYARKGVVTREMEFVAVRE